MPGFAQTKNQPQKPVTANAAAPRTAAPEPFLRQELSAHLQRTIGNQAVLRLLRNGQPRIQRKCSCDGKCPKCQRERVQAKLAGPGASGQIAAPSIVHDVLRSGGQPLDSATRAFMEPRFGQDFSGVRVHNDTQAGRAAQSIDAEAYTVGNNIVFAPGHFDLSSRAGRGLLAHELAHTVQQRGSIQARTGDPVSRAGDPDERAADAAAEAVLADRPAPELAPVQPVVARSPAKTKSPGFLIKVVVNEPVDGPEFCIRATMQGRRIGRDEAKSLLDSGALRCYGKRSKEGVGKDMVGQPIPFRIDGVFGEEGGAGGTTDVKLDESEKKEINAETDKRFWERIGEKRLLSKFDPNDAEYREIWDAERRAVLRERHPVVTASDFEYDPFTPDLRRFAAIEGLVPAGATEDIPTDQFVWMMQVQEKLSGLSERDWKRLSRIGRPDTDWKGLSDWVSRFKAEQEQLDRAIAKVNKLDKYKDLDSAYESTHGVGRGAGDPVGAEAYGMSDQLDQAASEFRAVFRVRALEVAAEMLRNANRAMEYERRSMQSRQEREALFNALASENTEVLKSHPILSYPDIREDARNPRTPDILGDWLRGRAYQQIGRIQYVADHMHEKPDVVFNFDVVVGATLKELGLDDKVQGLIIRMGWGKSDGSSLFQTLIEIGKMVLMIVPVIGQIYGAIEGFRGLNEATADYSANKYGFQIGMRSTAPSKTGVVVGAVGLALGVAPIPHSLSSTASSFGRMERIVATEAGTAGRVGADAAALRGGEDVAAGRVAQDVGAARAGEEVGAARVGEEVGAARVGEDVKATRAAEEVKPAGTGEHVANPAEPVREPVKGGHHVEVDKRGIEICSPDPCPLLRVEYAPELKGNQELADRLTAIEKLRLTDPKQAGRAAAQLRESLEMMRANAKLFSGLPAHVTPTLKARLASSLNAAEDAGIPLRGNQLDELASALGKTNDAAAAEDIIQWLEENVQIHADVHGAFEAAGTAGGGSRAGDIARELPEGAQSLGKATRHPKEVSTFLQRYPKVRATPDSEAALDSLYSISKSGGRNVTPLTGRYLPVNSRAAASELESIVELSARPEVEAIELVPSTFEGRTTDKIVDIRQADGTVVRTRYEDTTITGARTGYRPAGAGGKARADVERIESAVRGKVASTPAAPSQFDALMVEAPQGGTLGVHIQRPGPTGAQDVADAMVRLEPELGRTSVQAVEFFLPGQGGASRQVLRYVRQPNGKFTLTPSTAVGP